MSFVLHIIIKPVISVMLAGAKYLRVGNCLFLCVQGWGREHKVKEILRIPGGDLTAEIAPYIKITLSPLNQ